MTGNWLRFSFVLICFFLSWTYKEYASSKKDAYSLRLALFLTVAGDVCLILTNWIIPGLFFFCGVQLTYAYRYVGKKALFFICPAWVLIIFFAVGTPLPSDWLLAFGYAVCLLTSVTASFFSALPFPNKQLATLGMVLFLLCDLHVALYNLPFFPGYQETAFVLIWFFYFPSQVMLAISARRSSHI